MTIKGKMGKIKELFVKPAAAKKEEAKDKEENIGVQFRLSDTKETEIVDRIELMVQDARDSRTEFMAIREESISLYEGIKKPKSTPWENSSNISTMVTTVSADLLQAKLFPMTWNDKTLTWTGVDGNHDQETADDIKTVMKFVIGRTEMNLEPQIDEIMHRLVVDGTIIAKKRWEPYYTYITRLVPREMTPEAIIGGKVLHDVKYDYVRREKCVVDLKDIERVFLPFNAKNVETAEFIIEELWYTLDELREMKASGLIRQDIDLESLKGQMDTIEEFGETEKARQEAEGTVPTNTRKEAYKIKCYEAYMKYDVSDENRRAECVFLVAAKPKKFLSGKPLHCVSKIGQRPWLIEAFLTRPGRIYGKGVPELVRHLHKELDAIHNQRIDAGNMAIAPFFFFRAASGSKPGNIRVGPATGVPVDDPDRDIRFPTFPSFGLQVSFQEERIVMELIERLTYLTPAMMGKELASRPTVRGTLAVMSQGEQKFSLLARRCQRIVCKLLTIIKQSYEENMPPDLQSRILGKEGKPAFKYLAPETIAGQYDAMMQLDLGAGNIEMERQINTLVFQTMAFDPFVMQNPAYGWEVRAEYLKAYHRDPEKIIGPKPPTEITGEMADDIFFQIQQGLQPKLPGGVDAKFIGRLTEIRNSQMYQALDTQQKKMVFDKTLNDAKVMYVELMQERMANAQSGQAGAEQGMGGAQGVTGAPGLRSPQGAGSSGPVRSPGGAGPNITPPPGA